MYIVLLKLSLAPAVVSEKNVMKEAQRDNILKYIPLLRDPLYKLDKAANHLEMWLHGTLPKAPLLDVSAWLSLGFQLNFFGSNK